MIFRFEAGVSKLRVGFNIAWSAATALLMSVPMGAVANVRAATVPLLEVGSHGSRVLVLQEDLSRLGYLPESFGLVKRGSSTVVHATPLYQHTPHSLQQWFSLRTYGLVTQGSVMTFESDHGLAVDGVAGPMVWAAIRHDLASHQNNQDGYTYVMVSESRPETLRIWHNGKIVLTSKANTGIPSAPTQLGTFPVYLRYQSQTMSGVTPTGQTYSDPGVPYVSYFNGGDAVHGFVRSAYGYPQSLGCVELPVDAAAKAWTWMHYGTLVTVSN